MSDTQDTKVATTSNKEGKVSQAADAKREARAIRPFVDVLEDESGITLLADLPGVSREQLDLKVEGSTLQIEANVAQDTPAGLEAVYAEVQLPCYRRAFTVGREFDTEHIEANLKDGVLKLRIPKHAHAKPRRISIQTS